jgi:hypothetical protein
MEGNDKGNDEPTTAEGKMDEKNRPAGYAVLPNTGDLGAMAALSSGSAIIGKEMPNPAGPSNSPSGTNSVIEHTNKAANAEYIELFKKTAKAVMPYLPASLSEDEKIAQIRILLPMSVEKKAEHIFALKTAAAAPASAAPGKTASGKRYDGRQANQRPKAAELGDLLQSMENHDGGDKKKNDGDDDDDKKKKSGKSFGSAKAGAGSSGDEVGRTMGPGEEWLEFILGGQMQGGKVPYDIVTVDGRSWEVKALDGAGSMIRPGTEGRAAFAKPRKRLISIMTQIKNFVALARRPGFFEKGDLSESEANMISFVKVFVEDDYEMIVEKGEIGRDRFIAFRGILKSIQKFKHDHSGIDHDHGTAPVDTRISLNDKEVKVDKPTFIDVAKRVERATGDKSVLTGFEKFELLFSTLKDAAFDDPSEFFNEWFNSINIDNVFEHVDGVFIVNRNGFLMVPQSMFRKAFKFEIVSQGLPRFSLALPWGPLRKPINKLIQLFSNASAVCLLRMFQMASPSTPAGKFLMKEALSPVDK